MRSSTTTAYHVSVLSNFARGFDKYRRLYSKGGIPESTYPNEFYVLSEEQLAIGVAKASDLLERLGLPGDRLIALRAQLPSHCLEPNRRTGLGQVWPSSDLPLSGVHLVSADGGLSGELSFEDAMAKSLALQADRFHAFADIKPRSLSFLPIARGCQAACPFCFSEGSASAEQRQARPDWDNVRRWLDMSHLKGAERVVITGGGEPTLLVWADLVRLVRTCTTSFDKIVLISNGVRLAARTQADSAHALQELHDAGLSVLAISRHHPQERANAELMKLETHTPALLQTYALGRHALPNLRLRLICVLQRGGVETVADIDDYVAWAIAAGVEEVCFKELYVSTSDESVYHSRAVNDWSARNQISLATVHDWANAKGLHVASRLPWGASVFGGRVDGRNISVAAYTEPSLFWERSSGIARSWNVMADGTCLASLEDRRSVIEPIQLTVAG